MVVRRVGNVTEAIHRLGPGDKVGIRGPFGKGFCTEELEGKDVIFVAAGLGLPPLRSLIDTLLHEKNRRKFGRVIILYGAKTQAEFLFNKERSSWESRKDMEYRVTVDRGNGRVDGPGGCHHDPHPGPESRPRERPWRQSAVPR